MRRIDRHRFRSTLQDLERAAQPRRPELSEPPDAAEPASSALRFPGDAEHAAGWSVVVGRPERHALAAKGRVLWHLGLDIAIQGDARDRAIAAIWHGPPNVLQYFWQIW